MKLTPQNQPRSFLALALACLAAVAGAPVRADHLDLTRWESPAPVTNHLAKICCAKGLFYVVGAQGTILRSTNGCDWAVIPSPTTNALFALIHAGGLMVAVGSQSTILSSVDGATWTMRPAHSQYFRELRSIAHGNGQFVVAGGGGSVLISSNGLDWTEQLVHNAPTGIEAVTFANGMFFAVGGSFNYGSSIYQSVDGLAWDAIATFSTSINLDGIKFVGGRLFAYGWNGFCVNSLDGGATWTTRIAVPTCGSPGCQTIKDIEFGDGRWVLLANRSLWESSNGLDWQPASGEFTNNAVMTLAEPYGGIAYGHASFVAVAMNGRILAPRNRLGVAIEKTASNARLSWPVSRHAVTPEMTTAVGAGLWLPVPGSPALVDGRNVLTNKIDAANSFFRLRFDELP